jgi:hypothetical protein
MKSLRILWALPATCIGALLGCAAMAFGARARVVQGVLEFTGRSRPLLGFGAITFGHVIIAANADCLEACRAHEHVHVRQYERWGVLFFPLYGAASAIAWLRGGHFYRDNRFEREAYGRENLTPPRDGS